MIETEWVHHMIRLALKLVHIACYCLVFCVTAVCAGNNPTFDLMTEIPADGQLLPGKVYIIKSDDFNRDLWGNVTFVFIDETGNVISEKMNVITRLTFEGPTSANVCKVKVVKPIELALAYVTDRTLNKKIDALSRQSGMPNMTFGVQ